MFDFSKSLRQIEKNIEEGIGAYFVYDNIMQKAVGEKPFLDSMNRNIYFWHSILYSLQTTYFMCLGRVFDDNSKTLSINAFLNNCTKHINIFSKSELMKRKTKIIDDKQELQKYIKNAYEPSMEDFKKIKRIIKSYRKEYEKNYKNIRNKVFGHTEIIKREQFF